MIRWLKWPERFATRDVKVFISLELCLLLQRRVEPIEVGERKFRVTGRLGLHARAAANLVRVASRFQSTITIQRLDTKVEADAKSILTILMLAASRGTQLRATAVGIDE